MDIFNSTREIISDKVKERHLKPNYTIKGFIYYIYKKLNWTPESKKGLINLDNIDPDEVTDFRKSILGEVMEIVAFQLTDEISKEELRFIGRYLSTLPINELLDEFLSFLLELLNLCESRSLDNTIPIDKLVYLLHETNYKEVIASKIEEVMTLQRGNSKDKLTWVLEDSILSKLVAITDKIYFKNESIVMSFEETAITLSRDSRADQTRSSTDIMRNQRYS